MSAFDKRVTSSLLTVLMTVAGTATGRATETSTEEIDRSVWSVVSRTVVEHDIEGMAAVYHSDAILVSSRGTVPIAEALVRWGEGMESMKSSGATASVSFRFSTRRDDERTAFEIGMFNYTESDSAGNASPVYVPFEALLVKKDGRWLILMERQLAPADEAAWNAMAQD